MYNIWNQKASSLLFDNNGPSKSNEHWHSMATNVVKNVNASKDVYSWDNKYLGTIVPLSK